MLSKNDTAVIVVIVVVVFIIFFFFFPVTIAVVPKRLKENEIGFRLDDVVDNP